MGTKNSIGRFDVLAKAEGDEPYFVLLGRDRLAAKLIREWAILRSAEGEDGAVVMEALDVARAMDQFAMEYHARPKAPTISVDEG